MKWDGARYALKQIHHEPCEYYQFGDKLAAELGDYERLSALGVPLPRLLDVDREGELLLKELLPGETVYQLVLRGAVEPWHWAQVRALSQSLRGAGLNLGSASGRTAPRPAGPATYSPPCPSPAGAGRRIPFPGLLPGE